MKRCIKCETPIKKDHGDGLCCYCRTNKKHPKKKEKTLCPRCGTGIRVLKPDGLCGYCRMKERREQARHKPGVCRVCGKRTLKAREDGLCADCRRKAALPEKRHCAVCGKRVKKDNGDGLCAECRRRRGVKDGMKREKIPCSECGTLISGVLRDGSETTMCYRCRKLREVRKDENRRRMQITDAVRSPEEIRVAVHEKYGAAGKRIDEICRQDAEDRKNGRKHISYGMRMAMKK